ncbi:unnamed protein product [Protopolystoma xenopodis]|uniref:Uncharacterized protein n=1 Tax=Protopolystoma xenopodis TaxID=117903 RepID=A0A448XNS8_9PLAT|nr:unnamed protein product [Protopolystoma xenopodis]
MVLSSSGVLRRSPASSCTLPLRRALDPVPYSPTRSSSGNLAVRPFSLDSNALNHLSSTLLLLLPSEGPSSRLPSESEFEPVHSPATPASCTTSEYCQEKVSGETSIRKHPRRKVATPADSAASTSIGYSGSSNCSTGPIDHIGSSNDLLGQTICQASAEHFEKLSHRGSDGVLATDSLPPPAALQRELEISLTIPDSLNLAIKQQDTVSALILFLYNCSIFIVAFHDLFYSCCNIIAFEMKHSDLSISPNRTHCSKNIFYLFPCYILVPKRSK